MTLNVFSKQYHLNKRRHELDLNLIIHCYKGSLFSDSEVETSENGVSVFAILPALVLLSIINLKDVLYGHLRLFQK